MSCCQTEVKKILLYAREIHLGMKSLLDILLEEDIPPKSRLVAEYLQGQERVLEDAIHNGLQDPKSWVLNTFVDAKLNLDSADLLNKIWTTKAPTTDELADAAYLLRNTLILTFKEAANHASDRTAKELLLSLSILEETERNHLSSAMMQLNEL